MTQFYELMTTKVIEEGPLEPDYRLMTITTDDAGLITSIVVNRFRAADVRVITILQEWADLAQTTLDEFRTYIETTYGTTLMVVFQGEPAA